MAAASARIGHTRLQDIHDQTEKLIDEYKQVNEVEGYPESSIKAIRTSITANIVEYKRVKGIQAGSRLYDEKHRQLMKQAEAIVGYHEA